MSEEIKLYRPSNGTEGDCFIAAWCPSCVHSYSHEEYDQSCKLTIYEKTLYLDTEDEGYPQEWCYKGNSPVCTAYENRAEVIKEKQSQIRNFWMQPAAEQAQLKELAR